MKIKMSFMICMAMLSLIGLIYYASTKDSLDEVVRRNLLLGILSPMGLCLGVIIRSWIDRKKNEKL